MFQVTSSCGCCEESSGGTEGRGCIRCPLRCLQAIIEHFPKVGAIINWKREDGSTALHLAAARDDPRCTELLLSVDGIDCEELDNKARTPLHIACLRASFQVGEFVIGLGVESLALLLLKQKVDLNKQDKDGNTPLHLVAISGHEAIASHLVREKADVLMQNKDKKTPMHLATEKENDDVCYILQANGADVSIRYQWLDEKELRKRKRSQVDEEIVEVVQSMDSHGFLKDNSDFEQ